jgi:hypothetical protein
VHPRVKSCVSPQPAWAGVLAAGLGLAVLALGLVSWQEEDAGSSFAPGGGLRWGAAQESAVRSLAARLEDDRLAAAQLESALGELRSLLAARREAAAPEASDRSRGRVLEAPADLATGSGESIELGRLSATGLPLTPLARGADLVAFDGPSLVKATLATRSGEPVDLESAGAARIFLREFLELNAWAWSRKGAFIDERVAAEDASHVRSSQELEEFFRDEVRRGRTRHTFAVREGPDGGFTVVDLKRHRDSAVVKAVARRIAKLRMTIHRLGCSPSFWVDGKEVLE